MNWPHLDDPQHWRDRAEEARYVAQRMTDQLSADLVFQIATAYERLALRAAELSDSPPTPQVRSRCLYR
jgi:hypothetical protein